MSDHPYVPQNSDTSHQDDRRAIQTTAFGRRRMVTALLHGHSRSDAERLRHWPFAVTGLLATGLVAAGLGVANAYQDQQAVDQSSDPAGPAVPVIVAPPEPTVTATATAPSDRPSTPATKKPQTPTTKKQTQPKQTTKNQPTNKQQSTKNQTTKKQKTTQSSPGKKPATKSKQR